MWAIKCRRKVVLFVAIEKKKKKRKIIRICMCVFVHTFLDCPFNPKIPLWLFSFPLKPIPSAFPSVLAHHYLGQPCTSENIHCTSKFIPTQSKSSHQQPRNFPLSFAFRHYYFRPQNEPPVFHPAHDVVKSRKHFRPSDQFIIAWRLINLHSSMHA